MDVINVHNFGNGTKLTIHSVFESVADRDGMLQSGVDRLRARRPANRTINTIAMTALA